MTKRYSVIMEKRWTDHEPDTLTISLETSSVDGKPHIVFSGCATWLTPEVVMQEVVPFLTAAFFKATLMWSPVVDEFDMTGTEFDAAYAASTPVQVTGPPTGLCVVNMMPAFPSSEEKNWQAPYLCMKPMPCSDHS